MGEPAYRAQQVFSWLSRGVGGFGEMTNLPRQLREKLAERYYLAAPGGAAQAGCPAGTGP